MNDDWILPDLRRRLNAKLEKVAAELPSQYRLTLIARHTTRPDAGVLLTDDDLTLAAAELEKLKQREEGKAP